MIFYIPEQARENASKFLSDLEDTMIDLDVPVWKVIVVGLALIGIFIGSFVLFFRLFLWILHGWY